ncbi:hypothetical protein D3879_09940 [Pseudomonas cavernicola]|uniref:Uncharacterized protein n=1 Tax=Pseudomonas cavernicola TaxID=2320866 RepID=A0A418XM36_9PSED|nr:hypothetical protein [Pseudomonas cavernicola]RJG13538.1 hypothetical protein D3879_09940 [Pseudomonas cavernicola]
MDSATRIKVLGRLAQSSTPAADEAIGRACEQAFSNLAEGNEYEALEFSIEVLAAVGFRRSKEAVAVIDSFIRSVGDRRIVHSGEYGNLAETLSKYRNAFTLMSKGIEVLSGLRYLETPAIVDTLLWASTHAEESVRKEATSALSDLAKYNLSVYYGQGTESGRGIGATPQLLVIDTLEKKSDEELKTYFRGVLTLLEGLLSTSMESARWSSTAVTLSRAATPADGGVLSVRQRSIALLKKLYGLFETKSQKLSIIRALNAAARTQNMGTVDGAYADMISANAQEVLAFFARIVKDEDLQIVQKLEHDSYWIHYHSPSENVRSAALEVKTVIDANEEYAIYKTLVGFEGVFGDWSKSKRDESFALGSQDSRVKAARVIASRITDEGFDVWRRRILAFAKTESNDMATFPVFYEFLAEVAGSYPAFALDLLLKDADQLSKFLIPILRGLWDSEKRDELLSLIQRWVQEARPEETDFLYACSKLFLSTKHVDVGLLGQLLDKATELKDAFVLRQVASVAIARSATDEVRGELKALFLRALSHLTELKDANWVREIWFREETKDIVAELSPEERREVLKNLHFLPQIDYQAEDVLAVIAEREPLDVVEFLCARLYEPDEYAAALAEKEGLEYEELPFQFHTLQDPLSRAPQVVAQKVLDCYRKDSSLFEFRGAKLLQAIFPQFSETYQGALVRLIREGGDTELEFVAGVLRAYNGETFTHPVARELIKRLPSGSPLVTEVEIALQSTGVVSGEYGMAEAYERKRLEVLDWLQDPDDRIRTFAIKYISELEAMRDSERARAEESNTLRKFNYGEE